jgi:hypothetical protein
MVLTVALQQRQTLEEMDQPTLGYITQPASQYNNDPAMLAAALKDEKMWIAIAVWSIKTKLMRQINSNATALMNYAYQNGNQSYDPTGAIHIYYQEARNALVVDEFIIPFVPHKPRLISAR